MLPVGPLVEPPVDGPASTTTPASPNDGKGYDFAINDLLFKLAITDERPYQRATAQFRKDQFDSGNQTGDQSLTGWWTRGEFSFHKGAGITYYEVAQGDSVLNRYKEAEGIYPWLPGKVTCQLGWEPMEGFTNAEYAASFNGRLTVLRSETVRIDVDGASFGTEVDVGGETVRAVAVASDYIGFAALGSGEIVTYDSLGNVTTLYDGLSANIRGMWFVKSRLVVHDSDGKWYQLAPDPTSPPVTVGPSDVIFTATETANINGTVVTDTPGPILAGVQNRVLALTLDATGVIPTFSAPIQVGELPPGEVVSAMTHHLGFVVICTNRGIRVGVLSDSGQLTYGPLIVEHDPLTATTYCTQIAKYGTRVCALVDGRMVEIDLAQQVGTGLEFAWTYRGDPNPGTALGQSGGVVVWGAGTDFALFASDGGWWSNAYFPYMAGSLTTGFHRFNTLENKRFDSVRLSADGAHGTITVSKVLETGAVISLYTMDVSTQHEVDVSFNSTDGEQMIALKFDLAPDEDFPEVTPVLLGYQIRALPEPDRQRMIRIPLQCFDVERRGPANAAGRTGSAWERLRTLEQLEEANAVVAFRDYRTGEAGRAFIESIEFTNQTPPSSKSSGFGGIAFATLRKI